MAEHNYKDTLAVCCLMATVCLALISIAVIGWVCLKWFSALYHF